MSKIIRKIRAKAIDSEIIDKDKPLAKEAVNNCPVSDIKLILKKLDSIALNWYFSLDNYLIFRFVKGIKYGNELF